jgi:rubrerythrin
MMRDKQPPGGRVLERRSFFGIAGGALALLPIVGCKDGDKTKDEAGGASAKAKNADADAANDVVLLNKGILLEQGAVNVYKAAAGLPFIAENQDILPVAALFLSQHEQHRDSLATWVQNLGGTPAALETATTPDIPAEVLDEALDPEARTLAVLKFARSLEKAAADAYFQLIVQQLQTDTARRAAAEILPVEAQHVAVYDLVLKAAKPVSAALFSQQS